VLAGGDVLTGTKMRISGECLRDRWRRSPGELVGAKAGPEPGRKAMALMAKRPTAHMIAEGLTVPEGNIARRRPTVARRLDLADQRQGPAIPTSRTKGSEPNRKGARPDARAARTASQHDLSTCCIRPFCAGRHIGHSIWAGSRHCGYPTAGCPTDCLAVTFHRGRWRGRPRQSDGPRPRAVPDRD
jgi:hypothetical protein